MSEDTTTYEIGLYENEVILLERGNAHWARLDANKRAKIVVDDDNPRRDGRGYGCYLTSEDLERVKNGGRIAWDTEDGNTIVLHAWNR